MEGLIVVFNTSPLIFLDRLGYLEKSLSLFQAVIIPREVLAEIFVKDDKIKEDINNLKNRKDVISGLETKLIKLYKALKERLGNGEAEAISVAIEKNADLVILDDYAARKIAIELGLEVKGTLGVLRKLVENGEIEIQDLRGLYERLIEIGFRVRKDIFESIFSEFIK